MQKFITGIFCSVDLCKDIVVTSCGNLEKISLATIYFSRGVTTVLCSDAEKILFYSVSYYFRSKQTE
jgi:hypothetical protein